MLRSLASSLSLVLFTGLALAASPDQSPTRLVPVKEQSRGGCDFWRLDAMPLPWIADYTKGPISILICKEGFGLQNLLRQHDDLRTAPVTWSGSISDCGIWLRRRSGDQTAVSYTALCGGNRFDGPSEGYGPTFGFGEVDGCKLYAFEAPDRWGLMPFCPDGRTASVSWQGYVRVQMPKGGSTLTGPYDFTATSEPEPKGAGVRPKGRNSFKDLEANP